MKASNGPRYVVGVRNKVNKKKLKAGARVSLDMTTLTIMRHLPREVDPMVFNMLNEAPGNLTYSDIGGLHDQIRELREVIELPLTNPELFIRVGIKPPKGVLLYGPPGTGQFFLRKDATQRFGAHCWVCFRCCKVGSCVLTQSPFRPSFLILCALPRQDAAGPRPGQQHQGLLFEGRRIRHRRQVHRRERAHHSRDVRLCKGSPALWYERNNNEKKKKKNQSRLRDEVRGLS